MSQPSLWVEIYIYFPSFVAGSSLGSPLLHGVPYSTGDYTGLHGTTPFLPCTELPFIALQCTALHYTAEQCIALHCTALHFTVMHCTSLHPAKATVLHFTAMQRTTMQLIVAFFTPHFTHATANLAQKFA